MGSRSAPVEAYAADRSPKVSFWFLFLYKEKGIRRRLLNAQLRQRIGEGAPLLETVAV